MPDPKLAAFVAAILTALVAAIGILWRQLNKERRAATARFDEAGAKHADQIEKIVGGHRDQIDRLVTDHRAEMRTMTERWITASDKHVEKQEDMTQRMVEVLQAFSRKLDKRARSGQ